MISPAQSLARILIAAAVAAALLAYGLRGAPRPRDGAEGAARVRRWPAIVGGLLGVAMTLVVGLADELHPWDAGHNFIALLVAAAVMAGAAVLIRRGLRGRRVGDHPYCRRCGFDLFGTPAASPACNECGASLDGPAAVVVGTRERRMIPLGAGLFTFILALAIAAPVARDGYRWAQNYNWNPHKPAGWLLADLRRGANANAAEAAYWELLARAQRGALSAEDVGHIIDEMLSRPAWGTSGKGGASHSTLALNFAREGWAHGRLDEAGVRRVLRANLDLRLVVANRAVWGRVLRYHVSAPALRLVDAESPVASIRAKEIRLAIIGRRDAVGGVALPPGAATWSPLVEDDHWMALPQAGNALRLDGVPADRRPPPGLADVNVDLTATLTLAVGGRPTLVESRDVSLAGHVTLVDAATMRRPPATQPFVNDRRQIEAWFDPAQYGAPTLLVKNGSDAALVGVASFLLPDGTERPLGPILARPGGTTSLPCPAAPLGPCRLIVRARPDLGVELFWPATSHHADVIVPCDVAPP